MCLHAAQNRIPSAAWVHRLGFANPSLQKLLFRLDKVCLVDTNGVFSKGNVTEYRLWFARARALALSLSLTHSLSRVQASQIERQSVFLVQLTHRAGRLHLAADESASRRNRAAVAAPASWRPDRKAQTGRAHPPGIAKANSVRQEQCGRQMCSGNPTSRHVRKQLFRHVLSLRQAEFTLLDAEAVALAGEDNLGRCRRYRHNIAWRAARCCGWPLARAAGRGRSRSATCAPIAATTGSSARLRAHAPARRARMPAHASQSLWPDTPQHH